MLKPWWLISMLWSMDVLVVQSMYQFCLVIRVAYAGAEGGQPKRGDGAATAPKRAKPTMRLPMAIVKPKRKAEPPERNGHAAGQPAKKQEAEDGRGTSIGLGIAQADSQAATAEGGENAASLGLGGYSDSD